MPSMHTRRTILDRLERAGLHPFSAPITGAGTTYRDTKATRPVVRKARVGPMLVKRRGVA